MKVALVLPLTGTGVAVGTAMRNAAQLAFDEAQQPDLTILIEDDRGSSDGAREAAQEALKEGADIVLGPFSPPTSRPPPYPPAPPANR